MKLRLAHKGLILIAIPLVFEVAIFGCMFKLLGDSEKAAVKAAYSRQVLASINAMGTDLFSVLREMNNIDPLRPDPKLVQEAREHYDNLRRQGQDFQQLLAQDPRLSEASDEMTRIMKNLDESYVEVFRLYDSGDMVALARRIERLRDKYKALYEDVKMIKDVNRMVRDDANIVAEEPLIQAKIRGQTEQLLKAALAVSVLITITSSLFFFRQIVNRLRPMVDNSHRLADGKALHPLVAGTDEIADVDRAFHDMAVALKEAKDRDAAAQLLRDYVVRMVTHDLRSPLQNLSTFNELIEPAMTDDKMKRWHEIAGNNIERMTALVSDLLDLERIQAGGISIESTSFDLRSLIRECEHVVAAALAGKQIQLNVDADGTVYGDRKRVAQVLTNILSNAIKHSSVGGTVSIVGRDDDASNTVISVIDQGKGIPADQIERIFQPFHQVDSTQGTGKGGFGFGLAICKALVESHGGRITCESEPGVQTTFSFSLPKQPLSSMQQPLLSPTDRASPLAETLERTS